MFTMLFDSLGRLAGQDRIVSGLLFLFVLATRLPFQSRILYHWDSVNFAYAIREFDLAKEQPQPPGYILYVWLCRIVNAVANDAQTTMVSISIVSSALAVVALFYLGRSMFNRRVGVFAALFLATSPLFWFYGEIAAPHALDTLLIIVSVWWLYEVMQGAHQYLYPVAAGLAIAGGVRQQTLVFLLPLVLFSVRRVRWQRFMIAGVLGAGISLAWFIPLMILSGGVVNYLRIMSAYSDRFQDTTSVLIAGWSGIEHNIAKLIPYTAYGWSLLAVFTGIDSITWVRQRGWSRSLTKHLFVLLWIAPPLLFYTFIHMGQQALIFVFLPALILLGVVSLERLLIYRPRRMIAIVAALVAFNINVFCLLPEYPLGNNGQRVLTRDTLVNSDRYYQERFDLIRKQFDPASTMILAVNWHHVEYYLSEYPVLKLTPNSKLEIAYPQSASGLMRTILATPAELGLQVDRDGYAAIVLFDSELGAFDRTPDLTDTVIMPSGDRLEYKKLQQNDRLLVSLSSFEVITAGK